LHWTRTGSLSHTVLLHDGHLLGRSSPPTQTFPHTRQVRLTGRGESHLVLLHSGHLHGLESVLGRHSWSQRLQ